MMAIMYSGIKKSKIEEMIKSTEFNNFKKCIEEKLGIQDVTYEIVIQDIASDEEGYGKVETNARTIFENNYSEIKKIIFFVEAIKGNIENKFERISNDKSIFNKIVDIFIRNALVHELIHVQQFKNRMLIKEVIEQEKKMPYQQRPLEIEAESEAKQIISSYGAFEKEIMDYICSDKSINNDDTKRIIELYSKQFSK